MTETCTLNEFPSGRDFDSLPTQIGGYRILRRIGEGGMGIVFEASQISPKRSVALKVLRSHIRDRQQIRRLRMEAEFLARLQHKGIAHVFDAGVDQDRETGSNQCYLVMELIDGVPLTEHARRESLDVGGRLSLLVEVCAAVHHAHERGIVHRDLKPSNILVDSHGQPKILDFGVARALDADLEATLLTESGQLLGTLPYMSPEQARGDSNDVDARSDVYALGVILYELLTGQLPHIAEGHTLPEFMRRIQEEDPPSVGRIVKSLRGDLETVVAKALEKEAHRRYPSAAELAADLQRFSRCEPIAARPPSRCYQIARFAKRHRVLVTALATTLVTLSLGLLGTGYFAWEQSRSRADAERARVVASDAEASARLAMKEAKLEANRFEAVNGFLHGIFRRAHPHNHPEGFQATVSGMLDDAARRLESDGPMDREIESAIRYTLGDAFLALGNLASAETQVRRALHIDKELLGEGSSGVLNDRLLLGRVLHEKGEDDGAEHELLAVIAARPGQSPYAHHTLAHLYLVQQRYVEAEAHARLAIAQLRSSSQGDRRDVAASLGHLAMVLWRSGSGEPGEAQHCFQESIRLYRECHGPNHPSVARAMVNLAVFLRQSEAYDECLETYRQSLAIFRRAYGEEHVVISTVLNNIGRVLHGQQKLEEAQGHYEEALSLRGRLLGDDHRELSQIALNLASLNADRGNVSQQIHYLKLALRIDEAALGSEHPSVVQVLEELGAACLSQGLYEEAGEFLEASLEHGESLVRDPIHLAGLHRSLALAYDGLGLPEEAVHHFLITLETLDPLIPAHVPMRNLATVRLSKLYRDQGRIDDAELLESTSR